MKKLFCFIILIIISFSLFACNANDSFKDEIIEPDDQPKLINENASANSRLLFSYLTQSYKSVVLSGQYINTFDDYSKDKFLTDTNDKTSWTVFKADELVAVNSVTDDYPLILGLDAVLFTLGTDQITVDFATEWHKNGGIVTMCWHWICPNRDAGNSSFYSDSTDFSLKAALADKNSEDYSALLKDIDAVSEKLAILNEADVPILWRPLHEASGGWFWWGADGKDSYLELYDIMYDRMVNYHGLNNLIWLANAQDKDWYVGDDKCDILSDDPYYTNSSKFLYNINKANKIRYQDCVNTTPNKIIAMSENEFLPDVDKMFEEEVYWSMFATWCRDYVCVVEDDGTVTNTYSEKYVSKSDLIKTYQNPKVITFNKRNKIYG